MNELNAGTDKPEAAVALDRLETQIFITNEIANEILNVCNKIRDVDRNPTIETKEKYYQGLIWNIDKKENFLSNTNEILKEAKTILKQLFG
jgi:hypothetical protein